MTAFFGMGNGGQRRGARVRDFILSALRAGAAAWIAAVALGVIAALWVVAPNDAQAKCLDVPGDIDATGTTNVGDVQCSILVGLWNLAGQAGAYPTCVATEIVDADINCDGNLNVSDIQLFISLALKLPLPVAVDIDGDLCPELCKIDTDGDGEPNLTDCAPFIASVYPGAPETCNGLDDDCDGERDEEVGANAVVCSNNDVCDGVEVCNGPPADAPLVITELMINPGEAGASDDAFAEWIEIYNPGTQAVDLRGWTLSSAVAQIHVISSANPVEVRAGGHVILASNEDFFLNGGVYTGYAYTTVQLDNTADVIRLFDPSGGEVDRVEYNASWNIPSGASLGLTDPFANNNVASAWQVSAAPWRPYTPPVVEPPTPEVAASDAGTPGGPSVTPLILCLLGSELDCDDANVCTDDSCDPVGGCQNVANTAPCSDGTVCTVADQCADEACVPGAPLDCDDGNVCTDDSCDSVTGCVNLDNTSPCDDGSACTLVDICGGGTCLPGVAPNCDDGNPCTDDSCDPAIGCVNAPNTVPCDDGSACTVGDACAAAACVPGAPADCDDGNVCTDDSCDPATGCVNATNAAPCDDGSACTVSDTCSGGACVPGAAPDCDDGNVCTDDSCDPATGCVNAPNTAPCDDGTACTVGDACAAAACVPGAPADCDDGNVCTDDSCDPATGCVNAPNAAACDDGSACTQADACLNAVCVPGTLLNCDDGNGCTDDSCDPATGCVNANNAAACDDANACTVGDQCQAGACVPGSAAFCDDGNVCTDDSCDPATGCVSVDNTAACEDGTACTEGDSCKQGACVSGAPVDCDDGNVCTTDSCDAVSGCINQNNNAGCTDGDACTVGDQCSAGSCVPGAAPDCDDGNPCTDDSCHSSSGCVHVANTAPCDDGNACTQLDVCAAGSCQGTQPVVCTPLSSCHGAGVCDAGTGLCSQPLAPNGATCSDGDPCTLEDSCQAGVCTSGTALSCDDGNPCTTESCSNGQCQFAPSTGGELCSIPELCIVGACTAGSCQPSSPICDDESPCTTDLCSPTLGCQNVPNISPCTDGNACTVGDFCQDGACQAGAPLSCDDGNACTTDSCAAGQCQFSANSGPCAIPELCVVGQCASNVCVALSAPCDDDDPCTDDSCDPVAGCVHSPNTAPCDDGDGCTVNDACVAGVCTAGGPITCNDGNPCTDDVCVAGQCAAAPNQLPCQIAELCVSGTCGQGVCVPSTPPCDDGDACTLDQCVGGACEHAPLDSGPCDDGDACTVNTACVGGLCVGGTQVTCNDGNPCTDDACLDDVCVFTPLTGACSVPSACITGQCIQGLCITGEIPCDDNDSCTDDLCDPVLGCVNAPSSGPCEDGNACTSGDVCVDGVCTGQAPTDCGDGNVCTTDFCFASIGCVSVDNAAPCDDGDACTSGERCELGECVGGVVTDCDDGNPCTDDACVAGVGCVNVPNTAVCNDGNLCTLGDICVAGLCSGTPKDCASSGNTCSAGICDPSTGECVSAAEDGSPCDDGNPCTLDDICLSGQCTGDVYPVCADPTVNVLCLLSGTAGDLVDCEIRVVRTTQVSAPATGMQLQLQYDSGLELETFSDGEFCFGPGACIPYTIPDPFSTLQSGHSLLTGTNISQWTEGGELILVHLSDTSVPLTDAFYVGTDIVGDEVAMTAQFRLANDIPSSAPAVVSVPFVTATDVNAEPVVAQVFDLRIVTCSDASVCDTFACDPSDPLSCDDGNPCTSDTCVAGIGCFYNTLDGPCEDGDLCTTGEECIAGACIGQPVVCSDDGDPCTVTICNPLTGTCGVPSPPGTPCNDGDPCTFPDLCAQGACDSTPYLGCSDPNERVLCVLEGSANDVVRCEIHLARVAQVSPPPVSLQLQLQYPPGLTLEGFIDGEFCPAPEFCFPWTIPDFFPSLQSGHSLIFAPESLPNWSGGGGVLMVNLSQPEALISDAYLQEGALVGDSLVVSALFRLTTPFGGATPAVVKATGISSSDQDANPLTTTTTDLLIRTQAPPQ